jgi:hypothetical protein
MAENAGGVCMISPVKRGSSSSIASREGRSARVSVISPSASSVLVPAPQRTVKR